MKNFLHISIINIFVFAFINIYGQEADTVPPEISFSRSKISLEYKENNNTNYEETINLQSFYHLSFDVISPNDEIINNIINIYDTDSFLIKNESTYGFGYKWQIGDSIFYNDQDNFWFKPNLSEELTIKLSADSAGIIDSLIKKYKVVSVDTIAPQFEINNYALRCDFCSNYRYNESYDAENKLLNINAEWCDKFPEDFITIYMDHYFIITDNSESFTVTYKDSLYRDSEYLIRYYEAIDTSGNKSNLEVRVTRGNTPGQISNLYVYINDSDEPLFFNPGDEDERLIFLCDKTEVKINAVPELICADHSANYFWYINDKALVTERNSVLVFNLDTMNFETKLSVTVSESGSIDGRIKIIKLADELVKTIVQPSCSHSNDGSIQLVTDSWDDYLENLGPGVYPVSYVSNGCYFNDTITLVPENVFDFILSDTVIDLSENEKLTITNISDLEGEFSWQIGDSSFVNNESMFNYLLRSPGTNEIKLSNSSGVCNNTITKQVEVIGNILVEDKTPPKITIGYFQLYANYFLQGFGFDGSYSLLSNDTLEVNLSCKYEFPDDYYFRLENAIIEDDSGNSDNTIKVDSIIYDDDGYGAVIQTIVAKDDSGNTSNFLIIIKVTDTKHSIDTQNPTCINSADGIINLDPEVTDVYWEHISSNALSLNSLKAGSYYVSYTYNGCEFNDTIILEPENILDFTISDSIIDLSKNKFIKITNNSDSIGEFLWQIGDSSFINNAKEFDYHFKSPGNYDIKLSNYRINCNDEIKKIMVKGTTSVYDNPVSLIKISPNPFIDILNIEMKKSSDYKVTIYGVDGRAYFTDQVSDMRNFKVDLSFLNPGVYLLKIATVGNSELIKGFKIVKFDY